MRNLLHSTEWEPECACLKTTIGPYWLNTFLAKLKCENAEYEVRSGRLMDAVQLNFEIVRHWQETCCITDPQKGVYGNERSQCKRAYELTQAERSRIAEPLYL
jgi:hypothetical protein